jgi:hypothetical protein
MDFLSRFRKGTPDARRVVAYGSGFLHLLYDEEGEILEASWSKTRTESRSAPHLYFMWPNNAVTLKTPQGLSGEQWSGGSASLGTVYDDTAGGAGGKVPLEAWLAECLSRMIR